MAAHRAPHPPSSKSEATETARRGPEAAPKAPSNARLASQGPLLPAADEPRGPWAQWRALLELYEGMRKFSRGGGGRKAGNEGKARNPRRAAIRHTTQP